MTLAFAQMAYFVVPRHQGSAAAATASSCTSSRRSRSAATLVDLGERRTLYYTVLARWSRTYGLHRAAAALALRPRARRHPRQRAAHARARASRPTATSSPRSSIAGALAGLAGFLLAAKDGAVNPELLSLARVGRGAADDDPRRHRQPARRGARRGRVHAAEGAVPVAGAGRRRSPTHWQLTLGLTIIAFVALLPQGPDRRCARGCSVAASAGAWPMAELAAARRPRSTRRFGGLAAVDDVSLDLARRRDPCRHRHQRRRQVDADQHALGRARAERRARSARRRTTSRAGRSRGARAPASAAATSARRSSPSSACSRTAASRRRRARRGRGASGSARRATCAASGASRSARSTPPASTATPARIAGDAEPRRASASSRSRCAWRPQPRVLLLDEPLAGMGAEETGRMLALLRRLKRGARDPAGRARHGRGVPRRRPHHGDGQRRGASPATRPSAIRANRAVQRRLPRRRAMAEAQPPCSQSTDLHAYYGDSHVLRGVTLECRPAERARPARPQRHGQDDADPHRCWATCAPARGQRRAGRARDVTGAPPERMARLRHRLRARRAAASSRTSRCARTS